MTSQFTDTKVKTFTAGEAIEEFKLVYASGDYTVSKANQLKTAIGVSRAAVSSGEQIGIALLNAPGSHKVMVDGSVTQNTALYVGASGKATATVSGQRLGFALEAATADGDVIEFLPVPRDDIGDVANRFTLFDEFLAYPAPGTETLWTSTLTDSGTVVVNDAAGGILAIAASDGTIADNDEAYVFTTNEPFLFAASKPLFFKTKLSLAATDTSDVANVIAGFVSAANAANTLLDTGGGPPASYSGAVFYKVDGATAWAAECSIAGTQTAVTLTTPGRPSTTYQTLEIVVIPTSSTVATVAFYIDGVLVGSTAAFTYTSATEMNAGVGVKNGDGTTNTTLRVDYILASQVR